ncbi:MAG: hypothetical protein HZB26_02185 [Candidatus Hydrogenedentes bacterium]|nr:hypothetical protein [Candidatus Hydrogenedentota bacterium]
MKQRAISSQVSPAYATCGQVVFGAVFAGIGGFAAVAIGGPAIAAWTRTGQLPSQIFVVLVPLVFVIVGVAIMISAIRPRKRAQITATPVVPATALSGTLELKPAQSGLAQFIVMTVFAACWNGFVWFAAYNAWSEGAFVSLFMLPFVAIGIVLLAVAVYSLLKMFNPRPYLRLTPGAIILGGKADLEFTIFGSANRIEKLRILLEGAEEARYQQGTRTVTATSVFERIVLFETENPAEIRAGAVAVQLPEFTMHSFQAPHNKIVWTVKVAGVIRRWPDIDESFPITVLPLPAPQG